VKLIWPEAMSFNLMQNCCPGWNQTTAEHYAGIIRGGDALMFDGWWHNPTKNDLVKAAYELAHNGSSGGGGVIGGYHH